MHVAFTYVIFRHRGSDKMWSREIDRQSLLCPMCSLPAFTQVSAARGSLPDAGD